MVAIALIAVKVVDEEGLSVEEEASMVVAAVSGIPLVADRLAPIDDEMDGVAAADPSSRPEGENVEVMAPILESTGFSMREALEVAIESTPVSDASCDAMLMKCESVGRVVKPGAYIVCSSAAKADLAAGMSLNIEVKSPMVVGTASTEGKAVSKVLALSVLVVLDGKALALGRTEVTPVLATHSEKCPVVPKLAVFMSPSQ